MDVKKFTIDRAVWLRGEGNRASKLLREADGKMCCVGMYLRACGVPDAKLRGKSEACYVHDDDIVPDWTKNNAGLLYEANDDPHTDPATREAKIVNMFAEAGVAVEFVG